MAFSNKLCLLCLGDHLREMGKSASKNNVERVAPRQIWDPLHFHSSLCIIFLFLMGWGQLKREGEWELIGMHRVHLAL